MSITRVKIFGERHCATNAVERLICENFKLRSLDAGFLGWKHRLAPKKDEWQKRKMDETLVVVCVRHPLSWLKAMHKDPYSAHLPILQKLQFEFFVGHPIEDYESVISMWNLKYRAYLQLLNEVPNGVLIRFEHMVEEQTRVYEQLKHAIGPAACLNQEARLINDYTNGFGIDANREVNPTLSQLPHLTHVELQQIAARIDVSLMDQLAYALPENDG